MVTCYSNKGTLIQSEKTKHLMEVGVFSSVQTPEAWVAGEWVSLQVKVTHFLKEMEMTVLRTRLKRRGGASFT